MANQYFCQGRYWPFFFSFLGMIFIEGCSFSTYWAGLHNFLDFHGKVTLVCALTNLFNFPMIFMGCHYLGPQFLLLWREFHNFLVV